MDEKRKNLSDYNDILTTKEVCEYLRISKNTLLKLVKDKKMPCIKVGNKFLYTKNGIMSFKNTAFNNVY